MSEVSGENNVEKKKGKNLVWICVGIIIVLIIAMGLLIYAFIGSQNNSDESEGNTRSVLVNRDNLNQVVDDIMNREPVENGYYLVSMTNDWIFPNGTSASSNSFIENDRSNTNAVYFDINLDNESNELIYSSPVLPVGNRIDGIVLDKNLEAGNYNCVLTYHLLDDSYEKTVSTVRVTLDITVEQ